MTNEPPNDWVDVQTVAERFGVTVATVYAWARHGRIPSIRPSKKVAFFKLSDVEKAITIGASSRQSGARHE